MFATLLIVVQLGSTKFGDLCSHKSLWLYHFHHLNYLEIRFFENSKSHLRLFTAALYLKDLRQSGLFTKHYQLAFEPLFSHYFSVHVPFIDLWTFVIDVLVHACQADQSVYNNIGIIKNLQYWP